MSLVIFNMWLIDFGYVSIKTKYYLIIIIIAEMSDFMWLATSKRDGAGQMAYHLMLPHEDIIVYIPTKFKMLNERHIQIRKQRVPVS